MCDVLLNFAESEIMKIEQSDHLCWTPGLLERFPLLLEGVSVKPPYFCCRVCSSSFPEPGLISGQRVMALLLLRSVGHPLCELFVRYSSLLRVY